MTPYEEHTFTTTPSVYNTSSTTTALCQMVGDTSMEYYTKRSHHHHHHRKSCNKKIPKRETRRRGKAQKIHSTQNHIKCFSKLSRSSFFHPQQNERERDENVLRGAQIVRSDDVQMEAQSSQICNDQNATKCVEESIIDEAVFVRTKRSTT